VQERQERGHRSEAGYRCCRALPLLLLLRLLRRDCQRESLLLLLLLLLLRGGSGTAAGAATARACGATASLVCTRAAR
jgi:hypothetical protein